MEDDIRRKADSIELEVLAENSKGTDFYLKQDFEEQQEEVVELKGEKAKQKIMVKHL